MQDKYEMRFYKANYAKLYLQPITTSPIICLLFYDRKKMSEAAWKIYAKGNQFRNINESYLWNNWRFFYKKTL